MPSARSPESHEPPAARRDGLGVEIERLRTIVEELRLENEHLLDNQPVLEESRDDHVDLFESSPVPSLVLDDSGAIRSANEEAATLLGRPLAALAGRRLSQLVAPADRDRLAAHLEQASRGAPSQRCEIHLRASGGEGRLVQLRSRRSFRRHGVLQTILLDLGDRQGADAQTAELVEAIQSAQRANEAKDKFIAMLSHELRTPLTPVLIAATALQRDADLSPRMRGALAMIERGVQLESRLVDDLLDITRIVQGKMSVERIPTELHAIIRGACEALGPELLAKKQSVWLELRAERSHVSGDPVRMHQLFANLIKNAIKFSPVSGELRVRSWNGPSMVMIEVEDDGVGMNPDEVAEIFEPFHQLEQTSSPARLPTDGLGLGLAICKGITDLHGGRIDVASGGRGQGSRFVVRLPTAPPATSLADAPADAPEEAPPPAAPRDHVWRILLIEDHPDTAEMLTEMLREAGYDIEPVASVAAARAVDLARINLIVSDLGLPDGNGLDLIRQLQSGRRRPAIALSGFGMTTDKQASREAGFDVHLTKPVDFELLLRTIQSLEGRAGPSGPRGAPEHLDSTAD
ncbi:MAG: domain S-box [Myxococcales bacterium]|nr:domain S-box [Myxococcales bacterium]